MFIGGRRNQAALRQEGEEGHVTEQSKSWRLLSDVEQWILSQAEYSRSNIYDFITAHSKRVHHYPDLHAKVIVAEEKALVGSANFTEEGITRRSEMCVLLEDLNQVSELSKWFNGLWELSAPVDVDELAEFIRRAPAAELFLRTRRNRQLDKENHVSARHEQREAGLRAG